MPLEALQQSFADALLEQARVSALLPALADPDGRATERLALYRGNLVAAWQKALASTYPVVRAIVGEEFFDALAREYGRAHPSASGDLNRFGERFAAFVAAFEHTQSLPYLPDVAALEWLVHRAHYAADAASVVRTRIAALLPHELLALRFDLHPACAWTDSHYPVATIWRAHQPEADCALPDAPVAGEIALVVRPRWKVEVVASSPGEIAALQTLREDQPLQAAIEVALDAEPAFDLARMLVRWLDLGVLVRMRTSLDT
ncbi:MAG TPA: DNA-binding domain-containing protein [Xanthomonadaceae bacterium]|jgi:hypothetical protein